MADDDTVTAAEQAAALRQAQGTASPSNGAEDPSDEEDRQEAIHDILAELRGDADPAEEPGDADAAQEPGDTETGSDAEPDEAPAPEPHGVEQDEGPEPIGGPPADDRSVPPSLPEASAPRQRQAAEAGPRPLLPRASTPRSLVLLHALFVAVLSIVTILAYFHMASTLTAVKDGLAKGEGRGTRAEGRADKPATGASSTQEATLVPRPAPPAPVLQVDEGLRYVQEMEGADLRFEKGDYAEAAAGYARALSAMPRHWDDGACAFRLAECYLRLRDYDRAVAAYERVAASYPSRYKPRALYQLGEVHLQLKAYGKARVAFYDLLLLQGRYGDDAQSHVQRAYYRIADCCRLEAETLAAPSTRLGTGKEGPE